MWEDPNRETEPFTLRTYVEHYNRQRPHRALGLASPLATAGEPIPVNPHDVHSLIVTKVTSSEICMTYHSNDTLNRPLSELQSLWAGDWFYSYRT